MLVLCAEGRACVTPVMSLSQVLQHPWMRDHGVATDQFIPEVLTRMRKFTQMNKLKKEALKV